MKLVYIFFDERIDLKTFFCTIVMYSVYDKIQFALKKPYM